ncbi:MAG: hypothetical protein ACTSYZ_04940, partial [Candidatus Helarchaeota archaeon]
GGFLMQDEIKNKIIIDLIENESCNLDNTGQVKKINLSGKFTIINPSTSRIWNAKLFLTNINPTNLENDKFIINEVKPSEQWSREYKVNDDFIKEPVLDISEEIDTYYEIDAPNWAGIIGKRSPTAFKLFVKNKSNSIIRNVIITKELPEYFDDPILNPTTTLESLTFDSGTRNIIWKIDKIDPGKSLGVTIKTGFTPEMPEPYGAGKIMATYKVENAIRTKLDARVEANTDNLFAIDVEENMDTPFKWDCTAEFENSSNLDVLLKRIKIFQIKNNVQELIIEENPDQIIEINNSWSKDFVAQSDNIPKFKKDYEFSVDYIVQKTIFGSLEIEENKIPIAAVKIQKQIEPNEILANTKNDLNIEILADNIGSASLNEIILKDRIPAHFRPPEKGTIEYFLDDREIKEGIYYEITPEDDNLENEHLIVHKITNMDKLFGGFKPNSRLIIKYPIQAWNPPPTKNYLCPVEIFANTLPIGPPVENKLDDIEIKIKYVQRRIRAFKQIQPLSEEGQYKIPVVFHNKGEIVLENIVIKDFIPKNFDLMSWEPEDIKPEIKDLEDGTELIWRFPLVQPNEKLNLGYTIKGTGEYVAPELEIEVK